MYHWGISLTEMVYVNYVDFISCNVAKLDKLRYFITPAFERRQLCINRDKTERVTVRPDSAQHYKKLGVQLDADEDVAYRINQANAVFPCGNSGTALTVYPHGCDYTTLVSNR